MGGSEELTPQMLGQLKTGTDLIKCGTGQNAATQDHIEPREAERAQNCAHAIDAFALEETYSAPLSRLTQLGSWRYALPHSTKTHSLIWITKGSSRITIAGVTHGLSPNTLVTIPAGTPWAFAANAHVTASVSNLSSFALAPLPQAPRITRVTQFDRQNEVIALIAPLAQKTHQRIKLAQLLQISVWIDTHTKPMIEDKDTRLKIARRFTHYVEEVYQSGCTLAQIGRALDLTPTHLTRTLKATCAMTAGNYLNARIMHEARRRLRDTTDKAASISRDLSFSSPAYFSRAFAAHAGVPPGVFRES